MTVGHVSGITIVVMTVVSAGGTTIAVMTVGHVSGITIAAKIVVSAVGETAAKNATNAIALLQKFQNRLPRSHSMLRYAVTS